jgi:predicted glycoside hydrolase/deacetylase ChbG (UPF0249 family)
MTGAPRTLGLCADDFGLWPSVSRGIARLAHAQRLTVVSCITTGDAWRASAPLLADLPDSVECGLHFNLTEGLPLSAELARVWPVLPPLRTLIVQAHLRRLPVDALRAEWQAQLAAFTDATGRVPQTIDGHQHVHHLPQVRELLLHGIGQLLPAPAVRDTGVLPGPGFAIKRQLIAGTGGRRLHSELLRRGWLHNPALLGVYDFVDTDYRGWMQRWLRALPESGGLVFCHPGEIDAQSAGDAIAAARQRELAYLESGAFADDLAAANVKLGRVWQRGATKTSSAG